MAWEKRNQTPARGNPAFEGLTDAELLAELMAAHHIDEKARKAAKGIPDWEDPVVKKMLHAAETGANWTDDRFWR